MTAERNSEPSKVQPAKLGSGDRLEAIKARRDAATPGPWGWRGYIDGSIELRTLHSGGLRIITTMRSEPCTYLAEDESWGLTANACDGCKAEMEKDRDPFENYRCSKPENLDTVWLWGGHFVKPANEWAVREVPYRGDVVRIDHPDAELIAHAREDIDWLISEVDRLRERLERATLLRIEAQNPGIDMDDVRRLAAERS